MKFILIDSIENFWVLVLLSRMLDRGNAFSLLSEESRYRNDLRSFFLPDLISYS